MRKHLRSIAIALGVALLAAPAFAQYRRPYRGPSAERNLLRFHAGLFTPRGDSAYWDDKQLEFTGDEDEFEEIAAGFDYLRLLSERMALHVSSNFFDSDARQSYLDFVDERGAPIRHTTTLETDSFELGLLFFLTARDAVVVPYLGVGGGLYAWRLEEAGDFIDFGAPDPVIFTDAFAAEGETFGWSFLAGLEIPVSSTWSVFAEGRWQRADDDLGDDFEGFGTLDLSGAEYRAGFSFAF